jgi:hypothetical protein
VLSLARCRQILGKPDLNDKEIEDMRNALYGFSHILVDAYIDEQIGNNDPDHLDHELVSPDNLKQ